jgi:glutathione S-transferase
VLQWPFCERYSHEPNIAVAHFWMHVALDGMERHLARREYLLADRHTIADIALYGYTHVAHEGGFELERYPAISAWRSRVAAQPGHVPIAA